MKYFFLIALFLGLPALALAQQTGDTGFVPLTNIPLLTEAGNAFSLESFLNGLYRIGIGVAAVVAVLQIMRAGIMYMGGDSVTEKKEARNLIAMSIGGLVLVLSPFVVFSVINPDILDLKINGIEDLSVDPTLQGGTTWESTSENARALCIAQGGTPTAVGSSTPPTIRCTAKIPEGSCPTYPVGTSTVTQAQQSCCSAQSKCTLQALPRSQYQCICQAAAPVTTNDTGMYGPPFSYRILYPRYANSGQSFTGETCLQAEEKAYTTMDACAAAYGARTTELRSATMPWNGDPTVFAIAKQCNEREEHAPQSGSSVWGAAYADDPICDP